MKVSLLGSRDLRRRGGFRSQIKTILIISEGKKTEPNYFNKFQVRNKGVRIEVPKNCKTDPMSLIKFAKKKSKDYSIDYKNGDRVYCVYDVNGNSDELLENARKKASGEGISIGLSNPCFELWFLLHYTYYTSRCSCNELIDKLKEYMPNYTKNLDIFDDLVPLQRNALINAKKLVEYHKNQKKAESRVPIRETGPLTSVYEIVEYINSINK